VCKIGGDRGLGLASAGPLTRAKARAQAVKACQKSTNTNRSARKAKPYSQEEDKLLKELMQKAARVEEMTRAFQMHFPDRSTASLRKRWFQIGQSVRRSTRSRPLRHVA
jgi:hypothetical protein